MVFLQVQARLIQISERPAEAVDRVARGTLAKAIWEGGLLIGTDNRSAIGALATQTAIYFCNPHAPLQHGSNENTHGLLRQYTPQAHVGAIANPAR
jgi:hypothetical protein